MSYPPPTSSFMTVLDGLVALRIAQHTAHPHTLTQAYRDAGEHADTLAESGDRITAAGNFRHQADRYARSNALTAAALTLALGARQDGGITWGGRHWCIRPHPDCPHQP
jgi:hypothetical protein